MALSTLRLAAKPYLLRQQSMVIAKWTAPMALSAHDQMKLFWKKDLEQIFWNPRKLKKK